MGNNDHDRLSTFATIYMVVSVILAVVLVGMAISEFGEAGRTVARLAGAHVVVGITNLVSAAALLFGAFVFQAVVEWMLSVHGGIVSLRQEVRALRKEGGQNAGPQSSGLASSAPLAAVGAARLADNWGVLHCSACQRNVPRTDPLPSQCPNCKVQFAPTT